MRIISKFHDYYDTAMGMGIDPNLIYRRETKTIDLERWDYDPRFIEAFNLPPYLYTFKHKVCVLAFCGQFHVLWLPPGFEPTEETLGRNASKVVGMSVERAASENLASAEKKEFGTHVSYDDDEGMRKLVKQVRAFDGAKVDEKLFLQFGCPIFLAFRYPTEPGYGKVRAVRVITNPRLATLGFQHIVDSFTAFQEISMFLGSQLAPEDRAPRTSGDDKIIAASKGFDEQSFRTQAPGQKKLNRAANKQRKHVEGSS